MEFEFFQFSSISIDLMCDVQHPSPGFKFHYLNKGLKILAPYQRSRKKHSKMIWGALGFKIVE